MIVRIWLVSFDQTYFTLAGLFHRALTLWLLHWFLLKLDLNSSVPFFVGGIPSPSGRVMVMSDPVGQLAHKCRLVQENCFVVLTFMFVLLRWTEDHILRLSTGICSRPCTEDLTPHFYQWRNWDPVIWNHFCNGTAKTRIQVRLFAIHHTAPTASLLNTFNMPSTVQEETTTADLEEMVSAL